jgi:hypothetical protein
LTLDIFAAFAPIFAALNPSEDFLTFSNGIFDQRLEDETRKLVLKKKENSPSFFFSVHRCMQRSHNDRRRTRVMRALALCMLMPLAHRFVLPGVRVLVCVCVCVCVVSPLSSCAARTSFAGGLCGKR